MAEPAKLERSISLSLLVLYGVGTMVGGGFYALVGKVAGLAGMHAPFSMAAAALLALFSALSFGELAARYPLSAGESLYVDRAFGRATLSVAVGWLVILTGVVSTATLANAVVVFVQAHVDLNRELGIAIAVAALGLIAAWGIGESVLLVAAIAVVEVGGLLWVVFAAGDRFADLPARWTELTPGLSTDAWGGILAGGFLVFYAFLGFEDIVNIAEEVRRPRRNIGRAILYSLAATTVLYVLVTAAAVLTLPRDSLSASPNPLVDVVAATGAGGQGAIAIISVLAAVNGALVQVVMASRVAYGMSDKGLGPAFLARVHPWTHTPLRATAVATLLVLVIALWLPLVTLAQATSSIILVVFALVNLALWWIKGREGDLEGEGPCHPRWVPMAGFASSLGFLVFRYAA